MLSQPSCDGASERDMGRHWQEQTGTADIQMPSTGFWDGTPVVGRLKVVPPVREPKMFHFLASFLFHLGLWYGLDAMGVYDKG